MTEPLYIFIKGKGWVVQSIQAAEFQGLRFEVRKPKIGEKYIIVGKGNEQYVHPDGTIKWEAWEALSWNHEYIAKYSGPKFDVDDDQVLFYVTILQIT